MGYVNEDDTLELIRCIKGQMVELTAAQYAALPASEKNNGSIYFVTDEDGGLHLDDEPTANSGRAVKSGGIYTYTSKIGSGSLTTNAQTLIPAVNELKSGVDTLNNDLTWKPINLNVVNGTSLRLTGYREYLLMLKSSSFIYATCVTPELTANDNISLKFYTSGGGQIEAYKNASGAWTVTEGYYCAVFGK